MTKTDPIKNIITNLPTRRLEYSLPRQIPVTPQKEITQLQNSVVNAQFLKSLFNGEKIAAKTNLTLRETSQKVPAYITRFEKENTIHLYIKNEQAETLGYTSMIYPAGGLFKKPVADDYIYNSMTLVSLESKNAARKASPYRGIGTELLKAAVRESKNRGFGGRISLMAYDAKPPIIFYYKNGLRFVNERKDLLMQKFLAAQQAAKNELPEELQSGMMYLPEENIEKLLAM